MIDQHAVGRRLRRFRELTGRSQTDFAKQLGVAQNTYSAYENGSRVCSVEVASAICDTFHDITLDYIFRGSLAGLTTIRARELDGAKP